MTEIMIEVNNTLFKALHEKAMKKDVPMPELIAKMLEVYLGGEGYSRYLSY